LPGKPITGEPDREVKNNEYDVVLLDLKISG
jgi:hypothetical protein